MVIVILASSSTENSGPMFRLVRCMSRLGIGSSLLSLLAGEEERVYKIRAPFRYSIVKSKSKLLVSPLRRGLK